MTHLSKRERILIVFLGCILVAALMYLFFLSPQLTVRAENKDLYKTMNEQKIKAEESISQAEKSKKEILKLEAEAEELYSLMNQTKSYDVSLLLSDMLGRHRLTPLSLEFSDYEAVQPPESQSENGEEFSQYADEKSADYNGLDQVADSGDESTDKTPEEPDEQLMNYALKRTASLQFTGAQADIDAFLDELTDYNISYILSGYTLSKSGDSEVRNEIRLEMYEFVKPEEWKAVQEGGGK